MNFDRIVIDVLDWIRRVLFWRSNRKVKQKPYEIQKIDRSWRGILKLVRRDTPRAVRTWIFTPFPLPENGYAVATRKDVKDYHLCLNHLFSIAKETQKGSKRSRSWTGPTHRVMVLQASRYLNKDGTYNSTVLFSREYNFARRDGARDRWAIAVVDELASILGSSDAYLQMLDYLRLLLTRQ